MEVKNPLFKDDGFSASTNNLRTSPTFSPSADPSIQPPAYSTLSSTNNSVQTTIELPLIPHIDDSFNSSNVSETAVPKQ